MNNKIIMAVQYICKDMYMGVCPNLRTRDVLEMLTLGVVYLGS